MRTPPALVLMLIPALALAQVHVEPVSGPREGLPAEAPDPGWPVVFRGGPTLTRMGHGRVRWGEPTRELVFARASQKHVVVRAQGAAEPEVVARIPAPAGGEPRVYLSDRDDLAAFTVDFGTWDTCPEIRALRPGGVETIPLPCPEAGQAALAALQEAGHVPAGRDARARMRFRLANVRYVEPGFLAAGGVLLDAERTLSQHGARGPQVLRARFVLRDGRIQSCTLLD